MLVGVPIHTSLPANQLDKKKRLLTKESVDKKDIDRKVKGLIRSIGKNTSITSSMGPQNTKNIEKRLKEYQIKKYGKCIACGEPIQPTNCHFQCSSCGYAEN